MFPAGHHTIDKLYGVRLIEQRKKGVFPNGDSLLLKNLQTHFITDINHIHAVFRNSIQMIHAQRHDIQSPVLPITLAHFLRLRQCHIPQTCRRCGLRFQYIFRIIPRVNPLRRKIDKSALILHGISHQNIHQAGGIFHGLGLFIQPLEIGIISAHANGYIRIHTVKDFRQTATVICKIISLKYLLIRKLVISVSCQKIDLMPFFIQLDDQVINKASRTANQQNIHISRPLRG